MSLRDTLEVMDRCDAEVALEALRAGEATFADVPRMAQDAGERAVRTLCEAFDLDYDELLDVATERATLVMNLVPGVGGLCELHQALVADLTAGAMVTGIRLGLMHADREARR